VFLTHSCLARPRLRGNSSQRATKAQPESLDNAWELVQGILFFRWCADIIFGDAR
jgi:hypothetical protein